MEVLDQKFYTGERALFKSRDLSISNTIFDDGESPLKESQNIAITGSMFKWKYPLWYCKDVTVEKTTFFNMARAGMWYTDNISLKDCVMEAPKGFRRCRGVALSSVNFVNAEETLWSCSDVTMKSVAVRGDYFAMNCENVNADKLQIVGNYCFDGAKNIELHNSTLISKDSFWNSENVTVYDSFISGEYLAWNSKNVTFVNCTIESLQGMCYAENLRLVNCRLINTTLAFEYSTVDAEIVNVIDSVKNPSGGVIRAKGIKELIMEEDKVDAKKTEFILED